MVIQTPKEIIDVFDSFRSEIDANNDRRERLIKISREITVQSKRVIFLIHRLVNSDGPSQSSVVNSTTETPELIEQYANNTENVLLDQKASSTIEEKLLHIRRALISQLGKELPTIQDYWQHQRSVTPGIQEYIEAVSYAHYLNTNKLITHNEMTQWLSDDSGSPFIPLPYDEFLLGLSDLTGELMRFAITGIARGKGITQVDNTCSFVRGCKADFERLTPYIWELSKKQQVTKQSLQKIEEVNYAIRLRTAEYGKEPRMLSNFLHMTMENTRPQYEMRDNYEDN